jgi:hypothetical protein
MCVCMRCVQSRLLKHPLQVPTKLGPARIIWYRMFQLYSRTAQLLWSASLEAHDQPVSVYSMLVLTDDKYRYGVQVVAHHEPSYTSLAHAVMVFAPIGALADLVPWTEWRLGGHQVGATACSVMAVSPQHHAGLTLSAHASIVH